MQEKMTHDIVQAELKGMGNKITELLRHIQAMKQHTLPILNNYKHRDDCQGIHWEVKCIGCARAWVAQTTREKQEQLEALSQVVEQLAKLDEQYNKLAILAELLLVASAPAIDLLPAEIAKLIKEAKSPIEQILAEQNALTNSEPNLVVELTQVPLNVEAEFTTSDGSLRKQKSPQENTGSIVEAATSQLVDNDTFDFEESIALQKDAKAEKASIQVQKA